MAITSMSQAKQQFVANINWEGNPSAAKLFKEAIGYFLANDFSASTMAGRSYSRFDFQRMAGEVSDFLKIANSFDPQSNVRPMMFQKGWVQGGEVR